jgi:hypothetical protein
MNATRTWVEIETMTKRGQCHIYLSLDVPGHGCWDSVWSAAAAAVGVLFRPPVASCPFSLAAATSTEPQDPKLHTVVVEPSGHQRELHGCVVVCSG